MTSPTLSVMATDYRRNTWLAVGFDRTPRRLRRRPRAKLPSAMISASPSCRLLMLVIDVGAGDLDRTQSLQAEGSEQRPSTQML